jgi:hypothetical protein
LRHTCFYVALLAPTVDGGIPFLPEVVNQTLGRIAFGAGAVIPALIALYAFWEAYTLYRERQGI